MAIISPENRTESVENASASVRYISFDAEGRCLAEIFVDSNFDLTPTKEQLKDAGGSLRKVKDNNLPVTFVEGIPIEDVLLEDIEDYLQPLEGEEK